MKKLNKILWGVVLIAIGVILALNALEIISINIFFDGWWTLLIIIPSLISLFTEGDKVASLVALCVGGTLLLACREIISFDMVWKLLIPAVIIIIGIKLIFGSFFNKRSAEVRRKLREKGDELKSYTAIFSGQDVKFDGEVFRGARFVAIFGGIEVDLRGATIGNDCIINATAIFGGVDIITPENVRVRVNSNSIFGGVSNEKPRSKGEIENSMIVYINGSCMFGGVEIK